MVFVGEEQPAKKRHGAFENQNKRGVAQTFDGIEGI